MGEFSLCFDNWIGYSASKNILPEIEPMTNGKIFNENFLQANISEKYERIFLFPLGSEKKAEIAYLEKSLDCLKEDGLLIVLMLRFDLSGATYASIRQKILDNYSLEAVFPIKSISKATLFNCAIVVIKNCRQTSKVYMPTRQFDYEKDRKNENNAEMWMERSQKAFKDFKTAKDGFWVDSRNLDNRMDAEYYAPEVIKLRQDLQNRNCEKLEDIADVIFIRNVRALLQEKAKHGEYIIIGSKNIRDNKIHFSNNDEDFCSKDTLEKYPEFSQYILKRGDVLISVFGEIKWAIYDGDDNFAIASPSISIVRAKGGFENHFKMFFGSSIGRSLLEKQLQMFSTTGGAGFQQLSKQTLLQIRVPDTQSMEIAENLDQFEDFVAKIKALFKECGWNIDPIYVDEDSRSDLKLLFGGILRGILIAKYVKSDAIYGDNILMGQLREYKRQYKDLPVYLYIDDGIYEFEDEKFYPLLELPRPELAKAKRQALSGNDEKTKKIERLNYNEASTSDTFLLQQILIQMNEGFAGINKKMDSLSQKLSDLSNRIAGYQSLVERQLELASCEQERDLIIHGFTEECIERIVRETNVLLGRSFYNHEKEKLIASFGEPAWNKMDESSQNFLITSKVTFEKFISMADVVDFSGVCLLVTSALENELTKRFCTGFIAFLEEKYQNNYEKFPPALLSRYSKKCKPTNAKHFEIGSTLCIFNPCNPDWKLTKEQQECTQQELLDYAKNRLMKKCPEEKILSTFEKYAGTINDIRIKYRNKAAHTDALTRTDAKECFDLVIDVTKFLREMLDSFDE